MKRLLRSLASFFVVAIFVGIAVAHAQSSTKRIALRSGESVELRSYFFVVSCQSIMIGQPQLDVLEGPEEVAVTLKEGAVLPRARGCAKPVPGGSVMATTKEVTEPKEAKLTIRLRFNTKAGERQTSDTYSLALFPGGDMHMNSPNTFEPNMPATSR